MKIIVAHEGKQHSLKTAEALYRENYLFCYITTVYDKPHSLTRLLKNILRGNIKKKCASRRNEQLPDVKIKQYCEFRGLLSLFLHRIPVLNKFAERFDKSLRNSFGIKVAKLAKRNAVDAVIMYDYNSNSCFEWLKEKAPNIKRILDVTIANRLFSYYTYHNDAKLFSDSKILVEEKDVDNAESMVRLREELKLAQYFFVGSSFVKSTLEFSNVKSECIYVIPYGVNVQLFNPKCNNHKTSVNKPLNLIYVGNVCYRKGIHHLLAVVSEFNGDEVDLNIVGSYSEKEDYYIRYKDKTNIHFLGFVTHDTLFEYYQNADIFVLPSLSEGFAQVCLEAMSCGLPVICTKNSGCNVVIKDYQNGFVIDCSNRDELNDKIEWFMHNRPLIPNMGEKARKTALNYTWENYFRKVVDAIKNIIK